MRGQRTAGFIDVGSSKVVCLIVAFDGPGAPLQAGTEADLSHARIIGVGHQRVRGIKAGVVADLDAAQQSVRACIAQAERSAGLQLENIYISVSCGRLKSLNFTADARTENGIVNATDIARVLDAGRAFAERDGRTLVHLNRVAIQLDGTNVGGDPVGLAGRNIVADIHTVTSDETPLRNLMTLVERAYLEVGGMVAAPFASGLAATTEAEQRLGVTVIDIGAGTTNLAIFRDGKFVFSDVLPVGGHHMTFDIARVLQTPLEEAERIKTLYGTLLSAPSDDYEFFSYASAHEAEGEQFQASKGQLAGILCPRATSLLKLVREQLEQSEGAFLAGGRIVLTGGVSQMAGIAEFAAQEFQCPVRVVRPLQLKGLPERVSGAAFSTVVGMIMASTMGPGAIMAYRERDALSQGYVSRVGQWLKEGF